MYEIYMYNEQDTLIWWEDTCQDIKGHFWAQISKVFQMSVLSVYIGYIFSDLQYLLKFEKKKYLFKSEFDWFRVVIGYSISYLLSYGEGLVFSSSL